MITLRPAQLSDSPAIATLHANNWRQHYRGILSDQYLDQEVQQDRMQHWHNKLSSSSPTCITTLAINSLQDLIGFSCLLLDHDPIFGSLIDNLHVAPNYQRSGIGRLLLQSAAAIIQKKAIRPIMYLWVFDQNEPAKTAYKHLGAKQIETAAKSQEDGTIALTCRYAWTDLSRLL